LPELDSAAALPNAVVVVVLVDILPLVVLADQVLLLAQV
jgi:hypothetical protein